MILKGEIKKIRLNKFISNSGICSRREADKFISLGLVKVNDKIITSMGYKVDVNDSKYTFLLKLFDKAEIINERDD